MQHNELTPHPASNSHATAAGQACAAPMVLDTNVVLDWLLFNDARAQLLQSAICTGRVRWLACRRMRDELAQVLTHPMLNRWQPDSEQILRNFDKWAQAVPAPAATAPGWRCADPDDQVFIDLALGCGARWLLTHDRALLRLGRKARACGLWIAPPAAWTPAPPP